MVVLCRIGLSGVKGHELTCVLYDAKTSTLELRAMEYDRWENLVEGIPRKWA